MEPEQTPAGEHRSTDNGNSGAGKRSPLIWVAAGVVALLVVGGIVWAVAGGGGGGNNGDDNAGNNNGGDNTPATVAELTMAEPATAGRCANPLEKTGILKRAQTAFDGTVTSNENNVATLSVNHMYAGDNTDVFEVALPSKKLANQLMAPTFEKDKRYLVAANDGELILCGYSAEYYDVLAEAYVKALETAPAKATAKENKNNNKKKNRNRNNNN